MTPISSNVNTQPLPRNEGRDALPLGPLIRHSFQHPLGRDRRLGHADADGIVAAPTRKAIPKRLYRHHERLQLREAIGKLCASSHFGLNALNNLYRFAGHSEAVTIEGGGVEG